MKLTRKQTEQQKLLEANKKIIGDLLLKDEEIQNENDNKPKIVTRGLVRKMRNNNKDAEEGKYYERELSENVRSYSQTTQEDSGSTDSNNSINLEINNKDLNQKDVLPGKILDQYRRHWKGGDNDFTFSEKIVNSLQKQNNHQLVQQYKSYLQKKICLIKMRQWIWKVKIQDVKLKEVQERLDLKKISLMTNKQCRDKVKVDNLVNQPRIKFLQEDQNLLE